VYTEHSGSETNLVSTYIYLCLEVGTFNCVGYP